MGGTRPDVCVIFNPAAGKHRAQRRLEGVRRRWGGRVHFLPTSRAGHAVELARQAALDGYPVVAAAGGDGTAHEVLNGLMQSGRPDVQFGLIPIGSANDYAHSLGLDQPGASPPPARAVDVGRVRAPGGRMRYFGCNLGLGLNGAVTWESRKIRKLQGMALYGLATLRALVYHFRLPHMRIAFDGAPPIDGRTLMFSALIGRREGGFVLAPGAKVDDGLLDVVQVGELSRWEVLRLLPRIALAGPPREYPQIRQVRCRSVRLESEEPLRVHTDGEFFCLPEDRVRGVEIDVLPGALRVCSLLGETTLNA